jgi:hypothetical protein
MRDALPAAGNGEALAEHVLDQMRGSQPDAGNDEMPGMRDDRYREP